VLPKGSVTTMSTLRTKCRIDGVLGDGFLSAVSSINPFYPPEVCDISSRSLKKYVTVW